MRNIHEKTIKTNIKITESLSYELISHLEYIFFEEYRKHYKINKRSKTYGRNERLLSFLFLHLTVESLLSIKPYDVFSHISGPKGDYYKNLWAKLIKTLRIHDKLTLFFDLVDLTNNILTKNINKCIGFLKTLSGIRNKIVHGHLINLRGTGENNAIEKSKLYDILENDEKLDKKSSEFYNFLNFYLDSIEAIDFSKIVPGVNVNKNKFIQDIESIKDRFNKHFIYNDKTKLWQIRIKE